MRRVRWIYCCFFVIAAATTVHGVAFFVDPDGNDSNSGISAAFPFQTIQRAIDEASQTPGPDMNGVKQKLCTKCKKWKKESEFIKKSSQRDGLDFWCKDCGSIFRLRKAILLLYRRAARLIKVAEDKEAKVARLLKFGDEQTRKKAAKIAKMRDQLAALEKQLEAEGTDVTDI